MYVSYPNFSRVFLDRETMADDDERERCQEPEPEISSEENPIDEDELELSLGLRPIHPSPRIIFTSQKFPELSAFDPIPNSSSSSSPSPSPNPPTSLSKREVQAFRRREAMKKRALKRKASITKMPWLQGVEERERNCGDSPPAEDVGNCCKAQKLNLSYWAPPSWWCWNPADGGGGGFRPYQGQKGKFPSGAQNVECENRQSISTGSSSGISDISGPGGTSSDVGSHSSDPHSQPSPPSFPTASKPEAELRANSSTLTHAQRTKLCKSSSDQMGSVMSPRQPSKSPERSNMILHSQILVEDGPFHEKGCLPTSQTSGPKVEKHKPPKPIGSTNQQTLTLAQMPCVSVTGNGPNGKTITGLLYRYTQAEVSIVCVCHGVSFSPAGFVEHAGGVDVEHPLRHIRVVPCDLG